MRFALAVKFLPRFLVLQAVGAVLCYAFLEYGTAHFRLLLIAVVLDVLLLLTAALRFAAAARQSSLAEMEVLRALHAKEVDKIKKDAELERFRLVNKNHRQILRVHTLADLKIGAALAGLLALGLLMLWTQFVTCGLLALTAGSSGLAGYLIRARQEKYRKAVLPTSQVPAKQKEARPAEANARSRVGFFCL